jgi:hypothetical protein
MRKLELIPIKPRRTEWSGHVARMGDKTRTYSVLVGRREGKRPPGRPRRRWENNIKMDLEEVRWEAWTGFVWLTMGTGGGRV